MTRAYTSDPGVDRPLASRSRRLRASGTPLLLAGFVLAAIGIVLIVIDAGSVVTVIGVIFASLAAVALIAGLALLISGATGRWMSRGRPFA